MASERTPNLHGFGAIAVGAGLVAIGAILVWALRHGFYGTMLVAVLVAVWLTAMLWWTAVHPRDVPIVSVSTDDSEDERIMLRALLDQTPGALLAIDGARVRTLNRAARSLFATDDLVLPAPPSLLSHDAVRLRLGGRGWRIDRVAVQGLGAPRTLVALVDVETEEHAAEARATRDLLRVLGHEVMNAMAPITSLAESALAVMAVPERRDRLLPEILATLARRADGLRRFTEAYREVARLPDPLLAPVTLADLFADLARLFDAQWGNQATLVIADPAGAIASLDRGQIVQALLALLRNGVEASGAQGTVHLSATASADRIVFHVTDPGPGVDPTHRASIFTPFFTTKPKGTGIGLAAARQIAQSHGGDVTLRAVSPTTFDLAVPQ
ncbi:sensor histidine kinase [Sphingomonas endolithica]|uniref:sensor histidine kinase n=1 Tax=Sphingomonas endolithica TaxID=2972485 RepID=UPI0021B0059F|nr:ATP-binding protein [Sphingomonas sp. ZFBP2030]